MNAERCRSTMRELRSAVKARPSDAVGHGGRQLLGTDAAVALPGVPLAALPCASDLLPVVWAAPLFPASSTE